MTDRVSPLDGLEEFKVKPKQASINADAEVKRVVEEVAQAAGFPSRQPPKASNISTATMPGAGGRRRRLTGRNKQLNVKVTLETLNRFKEMADKYDLVEGELIEDALEAYEQLQKTTGGE